MDELKFDLDGIFPADDPRAAVLSGHGLRVRLERVGASHDAATGALTDRSAPVVVPPVGESRPWTGATGTTPWITGRAGMQYRDLVPDRLGGHLIASHIRIEQAGPVPDYVHFHNVRFQLIFCYRGWVRVVYEDQGPSFVLNPGDCVLQPPRIRHRVLECSAGLEVVELACPAEHETWTDRETSLPTATLRTERPFNGQRFLRHVAAKARWQIESDEGREIRDTGVAAATSGEFDARVVRATRDGIRLTHADRLRFLFVLGGELRCTGESECVLREGDAAIVPGRETPDWRLAADTQLLEVEA